MRTLPKVFMSHSRHDTGIVARLHEVFQRAGIDVWRDETSLMPGDLVPDAIGVAVDAAQILVLCLGTEGLAGWSGQEYQAFLVRAVHAKSCRIIPVLLPGAPEPYTMPAMLRCRCAVDLRDETCWDVACSRLVNVVRLHLDAT